MGNTPQVFKDEAVVLRSVEYGERDMIVTMLGRETGKFSAIAKGGKASRKRFPGAFDLFRVSEVTFKRRRASTMVVLNEATVLECFAGLEASFDKIVIATYYTELVREMIQEGENVDRGFERLVEFYGVVDSAPNESAGLELLLVGGVLRWLGQSGLAPSLATCFRCGVRSSSTDRAWYFSQQGEGALCSRCRTHGHQVWSVSSGALTLMAGLDAPTAGPTTSRDARLQVRKVLLGLARCTLGRELKSRRTLELVFGDPNQVAREAVE